MLNQKTGLYDYFREKDQEPCTLAEYVRPFVAKGREVTISGNGTSMLPTIDATCRLVMMPVNIAEIQAGDVLLYERPDGHSVIHRVWGKHEDLLDMMGDNQIIPEKNVPFSAVVARVRLVQYPDGREVDGHQSLTQMRLRCAKKRVRFSLGWGKHCMKVSLKKFLGRNQSEEE